MEGGSGSDDEEYNKTFIEEPKILDKYQAACGVADKALKHVIELCVPEADISEVCAAGDAFIEEELKKVYSGKSKKIERGIAFPTCINVNELCLHYAPLKDESKALKEGDVAKIDLGCHIDGYFGHVGTTILVSADKTKKVDGEIADLIVAGHTALQAAIRTCIEGKTNSDVTDIIQKTADQFGFKPLEGAYSHMHKKHTLSENEVIMNKHMPG